MQKYCPLVSKYFT